MSKCKRKEEKRLSGGLPYALMRLHTDACCSHLPQKLPHMQACDLRTVRHGHQNNTTHIQYLHDLQTSHRPPPGLKFSACTRVFEEEMRFVSGRFWLQEISCFFVFVFCRHKGSAEPLFTNNIHIAKRNTCFSY